MLIGSGAMLWNIFSAYVFPPTRYLKESLHSFLNSFSSISFRSEWWSSLNSYADIKKICTSLLTSLSLFANWSLTSFLSLRWKLRHHTGQGPLENVNMRLQNLWNHRLHDLHRLMHHDITASGLFHLQLRNRDNLNRWIHERSIKVIRPKIIQKWLNSYHFIQTWL